MTAGTVLPGSPGPLAGAYDGLLVDLDGVVYVGDHAVPHAAEALSGARTAGHVLRFVTNNASRTPEQVCEQLRRHGVAAEPGDVITSAQAAADLLADRLPAASPVLVVGGEGVRAALRAVGLRPVDRVEQEPVAVVQGFAPQVDWGMLTEGALAVRRGLPWVATNTDRTIPTPRGLAPGNGALVAVITEATGRRPETVGKPAPALFLTAARRMGSTRPLVVGDRLDTDITGARAAGFDSLLVLTGVTDVADLLAAPPHQRPTHLGADLRALSRPAPGVQGSDGRWRCRGWQVSIVEGRQLPLLRRVARPAGGHHPDDDGVDDGLDALRALAAASWAAVDTGRDPLPADLLAPAGGPAGGPARDVPGPADTRPG